MVVKDDHVGNETFFLIERSPCRAFFSPPPPPHPMIFWFRGGFLRERAATRRSKPEPACLNLESPRGMSTGKRRERFAARRSQSRRQLQIGRFQRRFGQGGLARRSAGLASMSARARKTASSTLAPTDFSAPSKRPAGRGGLVKAEAEEWTGAEGGGVEGAGERRRCAGGFLLGRREEETDADAEADVEAEPKPRPCG